MQRQTILAIFLAAIASSSWGSAIALPPMAPSSLTATTARDGDGDIDLETDLEVPATDKDPTTTTTTDLPEEIEEVPINIPLTRTRVERTLEEIAALVNQLLNVGTGPRPSVEDLVAYYDSMAQVTYYYDKRGAGGLQCLTREQYRNLLLDLVGTFPDPLQTYRYDYRIENIDIEPDGSEAIVTGTTLETVAISNRRVWELEQAWAISLISDGDRVLVRQEVSSEESDLDSVPRCSRPGFMSGSILDRRS